MRTSGRPRTRSVPSLLQLCLSNNDRQIVRYLEITPWPILDGRYRSRSKRVSRAGKRRPSLEDSSASVGLHLAAAPYNADATAQVVGGIGMSAPANCEIVGY